MSLFRKNISKREDAELMALYKTKGNQVYLGELYSRYAHLVMGVSLKYLKNRPEASDMTSHVYEVLAKKLASHEVINFSSWLHQLTKNECLMHLRRNKRIELVPIKDDSLEQDDSELTEKQLLELKLETLLAEIENLKPAQSECVKLFYLKKMSYREIVAQTKFSEKEVKSYIQNGKRNLKNLLINHAEFKSEERTSRTA